MIINIEISNATRLHQTAFSPCDILRVGHKLPGGGWEDQLLPRNEAIDYLHRTETNVFLGLSAFLKSGSTKKDCVKAAGMVVDIDYGETGHKQEQFFKTRQQALNHIQTFPLRPTMLVDTGHGFQATYAHDEAFEFFPGTPENSSRLEQYISVWMKLRDLLKGDSPCTPDRVFRLGGTMNDKSDDHGCPPVRARLLWYEHETTYSFMELEAFCKGFDMRSRIESAPVPKALASDSATQISQETIDFLNRIHEDRSWDLFMGAKRLIAEGHTDEFIHKVLSSVPAFGAKYGERLSEEISTCIGKIRRRSVAVYEAYGESISLTSNPAIELALEELPPLDPALEAKLHELTRQGGYELKDKGRETARFCDGASQKGARICIEAPCGNGKSQYALARIARDAGPEHRHILVVETIESMYKIGPQLETLSGQTVGYFHGFNVNLCEKLSGERHSWQACSPSNKNRPCTRCAANSECKFYSREQELLKPIVISTHSGLIRLCEENAACLKNATVIIDEDLDNFYNLDFTQHELRRLVKDHPNVGPILANVFPGTSVACYGMNGRLVDPTAWPKNSFSEESYTYVGPEAMDDLGGAEKEIKIYLSRIAKSSSSSQPVENIEDALFKLLHLIRRGACQSESYGYIQQRTPRGFRISCKKRQAGIGCLHMCRQVILLNASAQISPHEYPEDMKVFTCRDLASNGTGINLYVHRANPTKKNVRDQMELLKAFIGLHPDLKQHQKGLIFTNNSPEMQKELIEHAEEVLGPHCELQRLSRGQMKGTNIGRDATLVILSSVSLFTTIDDVALNSCLYHQCGMDKRQYVFSEFGRPKMPGGKFVMPSMREFYARFCLDLIYQGIMRSAARQDQPVDVILMVPDEYWLKALYETVLPGFWVREAFKQISAKAFLSDHDRQEYNLTRKDARWYFEKDLRMQVTNLFHIDVGTVLDKTPLANTLGFKAGWTEHNKSRLRSLLSGFFIAAKNLRQMVRN